MVSTEKQQVVDSLWTSLYFPKDLCLFIVYVLPLAVVGVRWKTQTLVHGEVRGRDETFFFTPFPSPQKISSIVPSPIKHPTAKPLLRRDVSEPLHHQVEPIAARSLLSQRTTTLA